MGKEATRVRRRERKNIASGVAHVNASFNNTMITITDVQGNTIAWSSSGTPAPAASRRCARCSPPASPSRRSAT
jgi:small subunit ribosomal protein S11